MNKLGDLKIVVTKLLIALLVPFGVLAGASTANAVPILTFSQNGSGTVTGTEIVAGAQTEIKGTNIPITISQIAAAINPGAGFLNFDFTSSGNAITAAGQALQSYFGTFSITSALNGTGTNFLSGVFTSTNAGVSGFLRGTQLNAGAIDPSLSFTSDVITALGNPVSMALSFSAVNPAVNVHTNTLGAFTSTSVAGTFSGTAPEPGSILLVGTALVGIGAMIRRRQKSAFNAKASAT